MALREVLGGAGGAKHADGVGEDVLGLVGPALVDEELGEVDVGLGGLEGASRLQGEPTAGHVPLDRLGPLPGVVGEEAEVASDQRLLLSEALVDADLQRLAVPLPDAGDTLLGIGVIQHDEGTDERFVVVHRACFLDDPQRPTPGLLGSLLIHPRPGREHVQSDLDPTGLGVATERRQAGAADTGDPQRAGEGPGAQVHRGLPRQDVGGRQRVVTQQTHGAAVGIQGLVEHPGEVPQISHGRPEAGPVGVGHAGDATAHVQRGDELVGGVGVGIRAAGELTGHLRVPPGTHRVTGAGEVQGQRGGVDLEVGAHPLEDLSGRLVEAGAELVGQALVGGVAHEAVAELDAVATVRLEEAVQLVVGRRVDVEPVRTQGLVDDLAPEATAENRRVPKYSPRHGGSWSICALMAPWSDSGRRSTDPPPRVNLVTSST